MTTDDETDGQGRQSPADTSPPASKPRRKTYVDRRAAGRVAPPSPPQEKETKTEKRSTYNRPPSGVAAPHAPIDLVRAEFARRLQRLRVAKQWNQSDLARHVSAARGRKADGRKAIDRSTISLYENGHNLPRPEMLHILAKVLECDESDLLPQTMVPSVGDDSPPVEVKDADPGYAWVRLNIRLPWDKALEIAKIARTGD